MREANNQNRTQRAAGSVLIEGLEAREMFSAAPILVHAAILPPHPAIVVAAKPVVKPVAKPAPKVVAKPVVKPIVKAVAKPVVKPVVKATPAKVVAPPKPVYIATAASEAIVGGTPNMIGTWTGTMLVDGSTTPAAFSVTFTLQHGIAVTGTFNLGATVGNKVVLSTMVFSAHSNVRAMVATQGVQGGFTGAVSENMQVLNGRFCFNGTGGFTTGIFTLNRN